jgi:hypothetical protein
MNTVVGREIMEHTGMTNGLEVADEVFTSNASIVFDQAETAAYRQGHPRRYPRLALSTRPRASETNSFPQG